MSSTHHLPLYMYRVHANVAIEYVEDEYAQMPKQPKRL